MTTNKMIKPSFRARLISSILKLLNVKKQLEKQVINNRLNRTKKEFVPKKIMQQYSVVNQTVETKSVATFETKQGGTNTHLILLHGGAYLFEAGMIHWTFAQKIVDKINCKMTLIDYPLAPEHDYKTTYAMVQKSYQTLTEQYPNDDFMLRICWTWYPFYFIKFLFRLYVHLDYHSNSILNLLRLRMYLLCLR
ncbi:MAG: alpha/beta hydrolase fold domain-containing protein, partial [Saprospiraceae bacterium]